MLSEISIILPYNICLGYELLQAANASYAQKLVHSVSNKRVIKDYIYAKCLSAQGSGSANLPKSNYTQNFSPYTFSMQ